MNGPLALTLAILLFGAPLLADTCPPAPDLEPRKSELMAAVRDAPTEAEARQLIDEMWTLWATAPDQYSQELLDEGMDRRSAFDFDGALKAFDALIDYCPNYAEGYNQRAFINFLREEYAASLADLDRALALAPDHIAALSGKALTQIALGRVDEGQETLRGALALNPWLPERHLLRPQPGEKL